VARGFTALRDGSADALRSGVRRYLSGLCCAVFLASAGEVVAESRQWYSYGVEVTIVDVNQYVDSESGVTILTRNCYELVEDYPARLKISARDITGSIVFEDGASCDVTGLIRYADDEDSADANDSSDNSETTDNNDSFLDAPSNMVV